MQGPPFLFDFFPNFCYNIEKEKGELVYDIKNIFEKIFLKIVAFAITILSEGLR